MTLEDIQKENETMRANVARSTRGQDQLWLVGLIARGLWEGVLQLAHVNKTLLQMQEEKTNRTIPSEKT
jgi:hypothetical protein